MNVLQLVERERLVLRRHVEDLPTDHSRGAGGAGEFENQLRRDARVGVARQKLERHRDHRVAGEDGDRFAEDFVVGGTAAAKVVVVHGGQVVVDEAEGVDQLNGGGGG